MARSKRSIGIEQVLGDLAGLDRELAIRLALQRGHPEARESALFEAQDVTLAPELAILLRQGEPVTLVTNCGQARPRRFVGRIRNEDAERFLGPPPYPATQLVELGEPETIRALNDHHRRLGHVNADFHDRRPDEDIECPVTEAGHFGIAVGGLETPMDESHPERSEKLAKAYRFGLAATAGTQ